MNRLKGLVDDPKGEMPDVTFTRPSIWLDREPYYFIKQPFMLQGDIYHGMKHGCNIVFVESIIYNVEQNLFMLDSIRKINEVDLNKYIKLYQENGWSLDHMHVNSIMPQEEKDKITKKIKKNLKGPDPTLMPGNLEESIIKDLTPEVGFVRSSKKSEIGFK